MIIRFGIRWRLGLIVIMALIAIWLSGVAAFYIAQGAGRAAALPTPGGLVALAKAVERTGPEDRALILTAMPVLGMRSARRWPSRTGPQPPPSGLPVCPRPKPARPTQ